jgi:hypothetical protein
VLLRADKCETRPRSSIDNNVFEKHSEWPNPKPPGAVKRTVKNQRLSRLTVVGYVDYFVILAFIVLVFPALD